MPRAGRRRPPAAAGGQPAGLVLAEGRGDQAEGPLGLPVGEQVRAVLPVRDHAEPPLVVLGQADQRLVHPGQVRGPVIGLGQAHAGQQGADLQLPGAHADGQHGLDPRRDAGGVDDLLERRQRDHAAGPPRAAAPPRPRRPGSSPATRSPSRWEQLIPAAGMNVARPSSSAQSGQPGGAQPGGVQPGQPAPAVQRPDERVRQVPAARIGAAADQPGPGGPGRGQQPGVVTGQHRHRARPGAADGDHHPAGPARSRRCRARRAGRRGSARRRRPGQTSPAARIRRSAVGWASASARKPLISAGL